MYVVLSLCFLRGLIEVKFKVASFKFHEHCNRTDTRNISIWIIYESARFEPHKTGLVLSSFV